MRFDELDLEDEILDGLEDMNFHEMTPVQEHTIPVILEGRDIIGCAQTGTGKTAAYTLPLLNKLLIEGNPDNVVKSLIIVPTRELAQQIDQQFQGFSYYAPLSTTVVYGGGDGKGWDIQKNGMLNGADVGIATPGRMIAHLQNSGVDLRNPTKPSTSRPTSATSVRNWASSASCSPSRPTRRRSSSRRRNSRSRSWPIRSSAWDSTLRPCTPTWSRRSARR